MIDKIINHKFILTFLFFITYILPNDLNSIKTIQSFNEVDFNDIKNNSLVIFDADDTLIQPKDMYLINEYKQQGRNLRKLLMKENPAISNWKDYRSIIYIQAERELIENYIIEKINYIKMQNIPVIVCTSLYTGKYGLLDSMEKWRFDHLKSLGFEGSFSDKIFKLNSSNRNPIFYKGIIVADMEQKGLVIGSFLDNIQLNPEEIIMFDDQINQLYNVQNECKIRNIKFSGYCYKGAIEKPWNDKLINFQMNYLLKNKKWINDIEAEKLLNQTNKTKSLLFLQGASRSGKSTICNIIGRYKNWRAITSIYFDYAQNIFNNLFTKEFELIKRGIELKNIRRAISSNYYLFKNEISQKLKEDIKDAINIIQHYFKNPFNYKKYKEDFDSYSLNLIQNCLQNGFNVITDVSWYLAKEKIQTFDNSTNILSVLLYCPFNTAIERLLTINKECIRTNNFSNYRFFIEPIKSFTYFYDFSKDKANSIDKLDKLEFIKILTEIEQYLPKTKNLDDSKFVMQEISLQELLEFKNNLLKQFAEYEIIYIIPKVNYDILIRTDKYNPHESIQFILEKTRYTDLA